MIFPAPTSVGVYIMPVFFNIMQAFAGTSGTGSGLGGSIGTSGIGGGRGWGITIGSDLGGGVGGGARGAGIMTSISLEHAVIRSNIVKTKIILFTMLTTYAPS